jgi:hypothetical protein
MGTRGLYGILYKGVYYLIYNQYDSYPVDGLGNNIIAAIKVSDLEQIKLIFDKFSQTNVIESYDSSLMKLFVNKKFVSINKFDDLLIDILLEYIYVINLDTNNLDMYYFSVNEKMWSRYKSSYSLNNLPDWSHHRRDGTNYEISKEMVVKDAHSESSKQKYYTIGKPDIMILR